MAVDIDSSFAYANALLGVLLRWRDRLDEAELCFLRAERSIPILSDWEKLLVRGFVAYWHDQNEEMAGYFNQLIKKYPDKIDGYFGAALAYERLDDYDRAIDITKRIIAIDSTHISAHGNLADLYRCKVDLKQAEKYALREIELFEASGDFSGVDGAYDMLGRIYHLEGKGKDAIVNLEKSIELSPRNRDAYRFLAEAYALNGEVDKAEIVLNQALQLPLKVNQRAEVYAWLANLEVLRVQFVDALSSHEKAKNLCVEAKYGKGYLRSAWSVCQIYAEMKHIELMENEWQNSERQFSDNGIFTTPINASYKWKNQFKLDLARGDSELAQQRLLKIRDIEGDGSKRYKELLAEFYFYQGNYSKAAEILQQVIKPSDQLIEGKKLSQRYYLAMIQKKTGEYAKAIENCLQILQVRRITEGPFFVYYKSLALLSEIYELLGEKQKAQSYCRAFLILWQNADPELPLLIEVRERMERLQKVENPS